MSTAVHASAIVVEEKGILIRGPSRSGKSLLSLAILERAGRVGMFSALVADDRVRLHVAAGRLIGESVPGFAGLIERRGEGILRAAYEPRAVLRLIVDLVHATTPGARMPAEEARWDNLLGVSLPRLQLDLAPGLESGAFAVLDRLARFESGVWLKNAVGTAYFA